MASKSNMAISIKEEVFSDNELEIREEEKSFLDDPIKVEYFSDTLKYEEDEDSVGSDVVVRSLEPDCLFRKDLEDQENREGERIYDADSAESPSCSGDCSSQGILKSWRRGVKAQGNGLTARNVLTSWQELAVGLDSLSDSREESFTLNILKTDHGVRRSSSRIVRPTSKHSLRSFVVYGYRRRARSNLDAHQRKPNTKLFKCGRCKERFDQESSLELHQLTHTFQKSFQCDECNRRFSTKGNLDRHLLVHSGEKPFACDRCEKPFSQKTHLEKHQLTHIVGKSFSCVLCCQRFSTKGNLDRHLLVHSGEKPYSCDQCEKSFSQRAYLAKHRLTHIAEKRFSCVQCCQRFSTKGNLDRHLLVHSGEKPYSCDQCMKSFSQKSHLTKHQLTHVLPENQHWLVQTVETNMNGHF